MTNSTRVLATLLSAAALVCSAATAGAQGQPARRPQQVPATGAEDAAPPAPTQLQAERALQAITSRSVAGLTFERRADGTLSINLEGRFQHLLTAAPGRDGHLDIACQTGDSASSAAVSAIRPWRPVKGGAVQPLDVSALRARLPRLANPPSTGERQ